MSVEETPQTGEVRKWNQLCSRSDSIQKSEGSYQKSRMDKKKMSQTCWGGSVTLCGLAGRTSSYSVNS